MANGDCNICPVRLRRMGSGVHIHVSKVLLVVKPSKIVFLIYNTIAQRKD